ncbi:MAG: Na/Pi cotransporter family protein [Ruminococcaceae bacterium]|nr:Na/Pi cotransporter family protein [Oscillospiraceae bacterium]
MNLFDVLSLFGGLALFLFGMNIMGQGLERSAGNKLKTILEKLTSNPFKGFLLGLGITAVIQSSSATTVMVVGFVNSGVMTLHQAIGIIMGANVGTTVTAWLLSLNAIEGDSLLMQLLKPSSFSPVLALIGVILYMSAKNSKKKDIGTILLGFAILMTGMDGMSKAVSGLKNVPEFASILTMFSNPILGVLAGAGLTAIIQSSSASVGILQALASTGTVAYSSAIPVILGQNIGTCVTAMISSVGTNRNARRAAAVHLYFNIIGTTIFLCGFYLLHSIMRFPFYSLPIDELGIAQVHTIFNLTCTVVMLPLSRVLEKLAYLTIREKPGQEDQFQLLDERLMVTPSVAIHQCRLLAVEMTALACESVHKAMSLITQFNEETAMQVAEQEKTVDTYEDRLGTYLVNLSGQRISAEDSHEISKLLHSISDIERISDHALSIAITARTLAEKNIRFSEQGQREFQVITDAVKEVLGITEQVFEADDAVRALRVEPLEQVVDYLSDSLRARHIKRLQEGVCSVDQGLVFTDLLSDYRRISDHCSNIAAAMIELQHNSFDTHEYLGALKRGNENFAQQYQAYMAQFPLPNNQ